MPLAKRQRTSHSEAETYLQDVSPFIAVEYDGRKVAIPRDPDYDKTIMNIKRVFSNLGRFPPADILLFVKLDQIDDSAQVTKVLWPEMVSRLVLLQVVLEYDTIKLHPNNQIRVRILMRMNNELTLTLPANSQIEDIREVITLRTDGDPMFQEFTLYLNGQKLLSQRRLNDYELEDGDQINFWHLA